MTHSNDPGTLRVAVLIEDMYEDQEFWYPVRRLAEAGVGVTIVGPEAGTVYTSKYGYPAKSDVAASDVSAAEFAGVIIPGGYAPDRMRRHPAMVELVRQAMDEGKVVAAICHAGWMLCSADVLQGKQVTSFASIRDDMIHAGAQWVDREVVKDGNLITSRSPQDLPAFMRSILSALEQGSEAALAAERAQHAG
jgi:protease I